jgi:SulP family sulfate permease
VAVEVGMVLACILFIRRMSSLFRVAPLPSKPEVLAFKLYGALFFGAVAKIDPIVRAVEKHPAGMRVELDASQLISLDATGLDALEQLFKVVLQHGGQLHIRHVNPQPRGLMERSGFAARLNGFQPAPATRY